MLNFICLKFFDLLLIHRVKCIPHSQYYIYSSFICSFNCARSNALLDSSSDSDSPGSSPPLGDGVTSRGDPLTGVSVNDFFFSLRFLSFFFFFKCCGAAISKLDGDGVADVRGWVAGDS